MKTLLSTLLLVFVSYITQAQYLSLYNNPITITSFGKITNSNPGQPVINQRSVYEYADSGRWNKYFGPKISYPGYIGVNHPVTSNPRLAWLDNDTAALRATKFSDIGLSLFNNDSGYLNTIGSRNCISITTNGTSGAATYNSSTGIFNIPNYTVPSAPTYNNSPARSLNTVFQISTTKSTRVSYSITCSTNLSLLNLNGAAQAFLEISQDGSTNWLTISGAGITRILSIAITLGINESQIYNIQGEVPIGWYCRIRTVTSGTGSTVVFTSGQEVQY